MKRLLSIFLGMLAVAVPTFAQESSSSSSAIRVGIEVQRKNNSTPTVHRAPIHMNIEAYYNTQNGVLEICYDGEAIGETYLYLNDNIIAYDAEINTSFQISSPGLYKIEVVGETWIAEGYLQL